MTEVYILSAHISKISLQGECASAGNPYTYCIRWRLANLIPFHRKVFELRIASAKDLYTSKKYRF